VTSGRIGSLRSNAAPPRWLFELLETEPLREGEEVVHRGQRLRLIGGVLRGDLATVSGEQAQTSDAFGFKWAKRETFESEAVRRRSRAWLIERYGEIGEAPWWSSYREQPLVLDAGCGAALSALELFASRLAGVRYLGIDISNAIDVAAQRFAERGHTAGFIQADIADPPLADESVDVIFSEGVLHHTDSTERSLKRLARLLRPGGRILFYVYRRKGPIREFTDDYVRDLVQNMTPEEAWDALMPITKLGKALGELAVEVDVPEAIELLGIPAGRIDTQRLFYWHVLKAYHHPDYTLDELNHITYDWYAPRNAHRQTVEEVRAWCSESRLTIERENVQEAGITVVAKKD
jgi:arsenite methyltransferase